MYPRQPSSPWKVNLGGKTDIVPYIAIFPAWYRITHYHKIPIRFTACVVNCIMCYNLVRPRRTPLFPIDSESQPGSAVNSSQSLVFQRFTAFLKKVWKNVLTLGTLCAIIQSVKGIAPQHFENITYYIITHKYLSTDTDGAESAHCEVFSLKAMWPTAKPHRTGTRV